MNSKKIIIALDNDNLKNTIKLIEELKYDSFAFKVGYEFFFNFGLVGYKLINQKNIKIFLDLKLHDIPNTVKNGIQAISKLNPYFTTVHISGGDNMQKITNKTKKEIKILGVSILTSMNSEQTQKYYFNNDINNIVSNFATYAMENKLDGVVCSPKEINIIKKKCADKLIIITPGIRPENYKNNADDQERIMTPKEALEAGADYLVIGRPITESVNPLEALKNINASIK